MSIFSKVPISRPKRNVFDLSHDVKLTTEFGRLTPFLCEPVVPGDRWRVSTNIQVRMAPMTAPVMQMFKVYQHFYYVPSRLLWSKWNRFIFGAEKYDKDGLPDTPDPVYPRFTLPNNPSSAKLLSNGSLFDYLGFPADANIAGNGDYFDIMPFRAYQLIYNEFYRDQNLQDEVEIGKDISGFIDPTNFASLNDLLSLRYVAWRKDYFTSALPFAQRGPDVRLPIAGNGSITFENSFTNEGQISIADTRVVGEDGVAFPTGRKSLYMSVERDNEAYLQNADNATLNVDNSKNLRVDLQRGVQAATINEVRRAFAVQKIYELAARVGGRPVEQLLGYFGVKSSDARLQRPEYLGGNVVPMYIGEVLQTSESSEDGTPLATPAGVGSASGASRQFTRFFEEHGYIIGLVFVVPTAAYFQGLPRKYSKFDRLDYYWPQFANIGEQEILNQELYYDPFNVAAGNSKEFGYTPRYAEYKNIPSTIHGDFRGSLDFWHDARKFSGRPVLNSEFITCKPPSGALAATGINRIFAVTETEFEDHLWLHIYNDIKAVRPMPRFGVPTL